ncbi:MAG: hypothetical protein C0614_08465 [Desulfuromonas sp.]|nr:MAG: hypothetical protein C0614_08465 [Desulfuromonas sp.]
MKKVVLVVLLLGLVVTAGCGGPKLKAPKAAGGGSLSMAVVVDRGITPDLPAERVKQYQQVGEWMERDLLNVLKKAGYTPRLVAGRNEFRGGEEGYLLTVKIVKYNPGSKAARILVGFGAGSTSLDTRYELYGAKPQPLLAEDHGYGSSIDWFKIIQKLNREMVDAVTKKLSAAAG